MGVLPLLPTLLNPQSSCSPKVANIIAEVAKNGEIRFPNLPSNILTLCSSVHQYYIFTLILSVFLCSLHEYIISCK